MTAPSSPAAPSMGTYSPLNSVTSLVLFFMLLTIAGAMYYRWVIAQLLAKQPYNDTFVRRIMAWLLISGTSQAVI